MSKLDHESLEEWRAAFAKDGIVYKTDEEYNEAVDNLLSFFEILIEIDRTHKSSISNDEHDSGL